MILLFPDLKKNRSIFRDLVKFGQNYFLTQNFVIFVNSEERQFLLRSSSDLFLQKDQ